MIYFRFHIGDWEQKTRLLSPIEKGIYVDLLTYYYSTEHPIVRSNYERITRGYTEEEKKAADYVLSTFFTEKDGCYYNKRCEEEIAAWQEKSSKSKKSIKARWDREKNRISNNQKDSEEHSHDDSIDDTNVCTKEDTDVCTNDDTNGILTINHKPITKNINNTNNLSTEVCKGYARASVSEDEDPFAPISEQAEALAMDELKKVIDDPNALVNPNAVYSLAQTHGIKIPHNKRKDIVDLCSQNILTVDSVRQCIRISKKARYPGSYLVSVLASAVHEPKQFHTDEWQSELTAQAMKHLESDEPF